MWSGDKSDLCLSWEMFLVACLRCHFFIAANSYNRKPWLVLEHGNVWYILRWMNTLAFYLPFFPEGKLLENRTSMMPDFLPKWGLLLTLIALRIVKTPLSFGQSECSWVKGGSNSFPYRCKNNFRTELFIFEVNQLFLSYICEIID